MQEPAHNFEEGGDESEVTLASPRFDAEEARHAHPVVPLEEVPAGRYAGGGRARFRGGARRRWPLSLIVVALLAVAALGAVAAQVLRRAHTSTTPAPASAAQGGQPTQTDTTPTQTVAAPPQKDAAAQPQSAPASTAAGEEKADATEEKTEGRAPGRTREERAAHTRHDEEVLPPPEAARAERRGVDGEGVEQRGHLKGRDGRDEARDEKEARKDSKHPKKGGARLVDVIVGPSRP